MLNLKNQINSKNDTSRISYKEFLDQNSLLEADLLFTHLTILEKKKLFELASKIDSGGYAMEIGSYLGASACFIARGLSENSKLICIDTWKNDAMSEGKRDTQQEFDENTKKVKDKIIKIKGYSANLKDRVLKITEEIDLLFFDGDHSYEGVKADWDTYLPMLKSGSIVIFHDVGWAEGVKRVIKENVKPLVSKDSNFELPNMYWAWMK